MFMLGLNESVLGKVSDHAVIYLSRNWRVGHQSVKQRNPLDTGKHDIVSPIRTSSIYI